MSVPVNRRVAVADAGGQQAQVDVAGLSNDELRDLVVQRAKAQRMQDAFDSHVLAELAHEYFVNHGMEQHLARAEAVPDKHHDDLALAVEDRQIDRVFCESLIPAPSCGEAVVNEGVQSSHAEAYANSALIRSFLHTALRRRNLCDVACGDLISPRLGYRPSSNS